ncbi:hypothetical protein BEN30_00280 [Magnetovibrio blakemorei]|uniref:Uncharacterized protein n=1 Tax=Magnetovibrio blakemorei TaxID=28181 RepID=A0A1E5Q7U5_9PROT|nr:hypothetical protein BEN30_00280 [Magnetovibrio blakemorei]
MLALVILGGLIWEVASPDLGGKPSHFTVRKAKGALYGDMPSPAEPSIGGTVKETIVPETRYRLMTLKHIPRIKQGTPMPHPFAGECNNCHLFVGGPGPGEQWKTPIGAALESISKIKKLGPPLLPSSDRPHPPAGRCIKCHDVVVKVPIVRKKGGFHWIM